MTKEELLLKLKKKSFQDDALRIYDVGEANNLYADECYVIGFNNETNLWEVFYGERGQKTGLTKFSSAEEAYDYFYNKIVFDKDINNLNPIGKKDDLSNCAIEKENKKSKKRGTYKNSEFFMGFFLVPIRNIYNNSCIVFVLYEYKIL